MKYVLIPRADQATWPELGRYVPVVHEGKRSARISCPDCGTIATISSHTITRDRTEGRVEPSVVCPRDCGFHEMVILEDWPGDWPA